MKRKIIKIDDDKCDGCGVCIPDCPEGALQVIDGKARLVSDLFCDGLGACIGTCPVGAITLEEREAEPYNEQKVMEQIVRGGPNVIKAHLRHLLDHGETELHDQAIAYLKDNSMEIPDLGGREDVVACSCPGSASRDMKREDANVAPLHEGGRSLLENWPIQLHLLSPLAPYFKGADILVAADCVAYSTPNFQSRYLGGKKLIIACPKLDSGKEAYLEKLRALIDDAKVNTITVMKMEVPCCAGILSLVKEAAAQSGRKVPIKHVTVGIRGEVLSEGWV